MSVIGRKVAITLGVLVVVAAGLLAAHYRWKIWPYKRSWELCIAEVAEEAIAPSSVQFQAYDRIKVRRHRNDPSRYVVRGWVTAENRLGGRGGYDWLCVASPGEGRAKIEHLADRAPEF
jgi:hypothetical protein